MVDLELAVREQVAEPRAQRWILDDARRLGIVDVPPLESASRPPVDAADVSPADAREHVETSQHLHEQRGARPAGTGDDDLAAGHTSGAHGPPGLVARGRFGFVHRHVRRRKPPRLNVSP